MTRPTDVSAADEDADAAAGENQPRAGTGQEQAERHSKAAQAFEAGGAVERQASGEAGDLDGGC